jgi:hypothetical protein
MDYLFLNSDGAWVFGRSLTSLCPSGGHRLDHIEGKETFTIRDRMNRDNEVGGLNRSPSEFMDADKQPYADFATFYTACKGFFFRRIGISGLGIGLPLTGTQDGDASGVGNYAFTTDQKLVANSTWITINQVIFHNGIEYDEVLTNGQVSGVTFKAGNAPAAADTVRINGTKI